MQFDDHFAVPAKEVAPELGFDMGRSRFAGLFHGLLITASGKELAGSEEVLLWDEDVQVHELSQCKVAVNRYREDGAFKGNRLNPVSGKLANHREQLLRKEKIASSR